MLTPEQLKERIAQIEAVRDAQLAALAERLDEEAVMQRHVARVLCDVRTVLEIWRHEYLVTEPKVLCDVCFTVAQEMVITAVCVSKVPRQRGLLLTTGLRNIAKRLIQLGIVPKVPPQRDKTQH